MFNSLLLLLEQSTVRNFEIAPKNLMLAETVHTYSCVYAYPHDDFVRDFSHEAKLWEAPTCKISFYAYGFCNTAVKAVLQPFHPATAAQRTLSLMAKSLLMTDLTQTTGHWTVIQAGCRSPTVSWAWVAPDIQLGMLGRRCVWLAWCRQGCYTLLGSAFLVPSLTASQCWSSCVWDV